MECHGLGDLRDMRKTILQMLYRLFPFDLKGDCVVPPATEGIRISVSLIFMAGWTYCRGYLALWQTSSIPKSVLRCCLLKTGEGRMLAGRWPLIFLPVAGRLSATRCTVLAKWVTHVTRANT